MFVNLFFIIRKNEIKYIMHDPHWGHGGHKAWVCSCAQRLDTTLLISRLALRAHNLITQLTLYDTPRPTKQKNAVKQHPSWERNGTQNKTKPNSVPGPQAKLQIVECPCGGDGERPKNLRTESEESSNKENFSNQFSITFTVRERCDEEESVLKSTYNSLESCKCIRKILYAVELGI